MINKVILVGNVGKDPEYKETDNSELAKFPLATSEKYRDETKTEWHNIIVWGKLASVVRDYVHKGSLLYVEGKIQTRSYESDGVKKYMTEINCFSLKMLGKKESESNQQESNDPPF